MLAGCFLLLAAITECRVVRNEKVFNFDLSRSHRVQDVNWPPGRNSDMFGYDDDCQLTLKLPGERVFHERLKQFAIERRGDSIYFIGAHMHDMSLEEVAAQAKRLMNAWHFDDRRFAAWYEKTGKKEDNVIFESMRNDVQPALALKVLHSFNDERPWFISFEVAW